MNKTVIKWAGIASAIFSSLASQAVELEYYLPEASQYNQAISTPSSSLGYEVGEWHVRPEQIAHYFQSLATQSPRVKVEIIGYTHEKRPLMLAYISSEENIARLEEIRQQHLKSKPGDDVPVVTWMGYSVHGNESSGSNASLLFAYHMAAAKDPETLAQLDNQIIIVDPMLNPDGLARFAHWANMYKSKEPNADPQTMEHNEAWPKGRTNHYWFDLNRDWLLLQHPESQARVEQFHRWRPNILTDFHEMGTNTSYFFQPGVHSRQNPLTPEANFKMTATIADYHAQALDNIGSLYYSKEGFDDFYYGKGSTYPDIQGTVGILFEQASSRGHAQESVYGELTFPFGIRNHLTTSFSTIAAAQANQDQLKQMREDFEKQTTKMAKSDKQRAVVFSSPDQYRVNEMKRLLNEHQIQHYPLGKKLKLKGKVIAKDAATIIPLQQPQYRLIKSMFEKRKSFKDAVFYDVSAWNMGLAFDLDYDFVSRSDYSTSLLGQADQPTDSEWTVNANTLGLAFDWADFNVARLLSEMQQQGLMVQGVTKPTKIKTSQGDTSLSLGSIILMLNNQHSSHKENNKPHLDREAILQWLAPRIKALNINPIEISSGLAVTGVDLGSPSIPVLKPIKPLMIVGDGVRSYDAGEVWHLLDQKVSQPVTMLTQKQLKKLTLEDYSHLILVDGRYQFDEQTTENIEQWVKRGGVIVAHSKGAKWMLSQGWTSSDIKEFDKNIDTQALYGDKAQLDAKNIIGGAITSAEIDITHPLGFGLADRQLAIFKRGQQVFKEPKEAFVGVARFTQEPHAAGYISKENVKHIADGTSILVQGLGKGRLIAFSDNPVFRGFWLGTTRVFVNALYYGKAIKAPAKSKTPKKKDTNKEKNSDVKK